MKNICDKFEYINGNVIGGLTNELAVFYMLNYFKNNEDDLLIVCNSLYTATNLYNKFQTYTNDILLFPMDDFLTSVLAVKSPELKFTRLETLKKLDSKKKNIVITNLIGYLKFLPNKKDNKDLVLKKGDLIKRASFLEKLELLGYNRESMVTSTSEYSVRGLIIDVFPIYDNNPVRIEFDGDEIESIRNFDEDTQISNTEINEITLSPANELESIENSSIFDYIKGSNVFFLEKEQIDASYKKLCLDVLEYKAKKDIKEDLMHTFEDLLPENYFYINNFGAQCDMNYDSKELNNYLQNFEKLKSDYDNWTRLGYEIVFCLSTDNQIKKIKELIPNCNIVRKKINQGFIFDKFILISEFDIDKKVSEAKSYKGNFKFGKKIKSYDSLEIGDYVVHIDNGIGIYSGIKKLKKNGVEKDYLQIDYSGQDKVYIPAHKITSIYKYSDKDGSVPKITNLNGTNWNKTRSYIQSKIKDISAELITLYKKRMEIKSPIYKEYKEEENLFDASFDYTLTRNQKNSVDDMITDLTSNHPMDRLLCGDVGFGKTEVAFRGIFNAVLNNYQVMYLCPTTILSTQQYNVALNRFKDWPIEIGLLNRFVSTKEAKRVLEAFKQGKIDILFGTHRILSDDVIAKNLGLLVVDEEQRFGVTHKEKIKKLKNDVNVLTLSATPIPRTLKMALSGIRDMSVIDTPPVNRYPIQTYVLNEDDLVIKDAVYKELSRGGQIFILYNKVDSISSMTDRIRKLIPEARVNFAHGQMNKIELEKIMNEFINFEYDILVCTTIIESGIDIPNVNTLLVFDADRFGLSQLYQIRGRVGRSDKIGYAYLFYEEGKILNDTASKRLKAIKDFTELGSGYKIAMRDLAIRGAGDIFGASQAGFIDSLGINLYLKMVDTELKRQRGEEVEEEDTSVTLIDVDTHINDEYVSDEDIKIEIHQLINTVDSENKFNEVAEHITNRFGKIPENMVIYMYEQWFEKLAKKLEVTNVIKTDRFIEITIPQNISRFIEGDKLLISAFSINSKFNIKYISKQIKISLFYNASKNHFLIDYVKLFDEIIMNNLDVKEPN
ncbi:MAG: transcription-repair coupling factor [bacterium]